MGSPATDRAPTDAFAPTGLPRRALLNTPPVRLRAVAPPARRRAGRIPPPASALRPPPSLALSARDAGTQRGPPRLPRAARPSRSRTFYLLTYLDRSAGRSCSAWKRSPSRRGRRVQQPHLIDSQRPSRTRRG